jgi:hypothetical protein
MANKYQTIPTTVHAVQWNGADHQAITEFVGTKLRAIQAYSPRNKPVLNLQTLTGNVSLDMGDYLVMDNVGNFKSMKPFEFETSHVLVKDEEEKDIDKPVDKPKEADKPKEVEKEKPVVDDEKDKVNEAEPDKDEEYELEDVEDVEDVEEDEEDEEDE